MRLQLEEIREQALPGARQSDRPGAVRLSARAARPSIRSQIKVAGAASLVGRATEAVVDVSVAAYRLGQRRLHAAHRRRSRQRSEGSEPAHHAALGHRAGPDHPADPVQGSRRAARDVRASPRPATCSSRSRSIRRRRRWSGDANALEGTNFVDTAPVDINGISTTVGAQRCAWRRRQGTLPAAAGQTVTVTVRVTTLTGQPDRPRAPVGDQSRRAPCSSSRPPDLVSVTISGPAPVLSTLVLNPNDFKVVLDVSWQGPGQLRRRREGASRCPPVSRSKTSSRKKVQVDLRDAPPPTPTPAPTPTPLPPPPRPAGG